jgi:hypothetical protein
VPTTPYPTFSPTPLVSFSCQNFSVSNTNSDSVNYATCSYTLASAYSSATVTASTCSAYTGDTYLRAYISGVQVASNDDYCDYGSQMSFTLRYAEIVTITEGCYDATSCAGTVTLTFTDQALTGGNPTMTPTISFAPTPILQPTSSQFPLSLTCTGSRTQVVQVPSGVAQMRIAAYGAQGSVNGGLGGFIGCTIPVTPGTSLSVYVGCAGTSGGFPDGGVPGNPASGSVATDGYGGGSSSIRSTSVLVVAGAGGILKLTISS